jgi:hypothetical protein
MPALHLEKGVCQVRQATTAIADAQSNRPVTRKPRGGLVVWSRPAAVLEASVRVAQELPGHSRISVARVDDYLLLYRRPSSSHSYIGGL